MILIFMNKPRNVILKKLENMDQFQPKYFSSFNLSFLSSLFSYFSSLNKQKIHRQTLKYQIYIQTYMGQTVQLASDLFGETIYKKLMEQYGSSLMKFFLIERSKEVIKEKFIQLIAESEKIIASVQTSIRAFINQQIQKLKNIFEEAKSMIEEKIPGGIAAIEMFKGQSVENLSGFNYLIQKINSIKEQSFQKIQQKKKEVHTDLQNHKFTMINKMEQERPKIPLYEDLPPEVKTQVIKLVESQLGDKIIENKQSILKELQANFIPNSYKTLGNLEKELNPEALLTNLTNNALSSLTNNIIEASKDYLPVF